MILNHQPIVFVIVVFLEYFHNKPAWSTSDFKSLDIPFLFVKCDSLTDSLFFFFLNLTRIKRQHWVVWFNLQIPFFLFFKIKKNTSG